MQHAGVKAACAICRTVPFGDLSGQHDAFSQHLLSNFIYSAIFHHIAPQAIFSVVRKDRLGAPLLICLHQVPDLAHLGLLYLMYPRAVGKYGCSVVQARL